jgi:hypothetical protein
VDLSLTGEQRAVRDAFAALFGKQATPQRVRAAEVTGFDGLLWRHYAEVGALGIGSPPTAGVGTAPWMRTIAAQSRRRSTADPARCCAASSWRTGWDFRVAVHGVEGCGSSIRSRRIDSEQRTRRKLDHAQRVVEMLVRLGVAG